MHRLCMCVCDLLFKLEKTEYASPFYEKLVIFHILKKPLFPKPYTGMASFYPVPIQEFLYLLRELIYKWQIESDHDAALYIVEN